MVPVKGRGPEKSAMTISGLQAREGLHLKRLFNISARSWNGNAACNSIFCLLKPRITENAPSVTTQVVHQRELSSKGGLAQLVERLLCKQNVNGSNPLTSTILLLRSFSEVGYGWQAIA
jgi:hypothetical protein